VGGQSVYSIVGWTGEHNGERLTQFGDDLLYGQRALTVRQEMLLGITSTDLGVASLGKKGTAVGQVSLVVPKAGAGTAATYSCSSMTVDRNSSRGGYGELSMCDMVFASEGTGGTDPTVVVGAVA
jgi:hypothetical protein